MVGQNGSKQFIRGTSKASSLAEKPAPPSTKVMVLERTAQRFILDPRNYGNDVLLLSTVCKITGS